MSGAPLVQPAAPWPMYRALVGIGMLCGLLIVFVGAGSLVMPRQFPAFVGALATFAILGEQLFTQIVYPGVAANYPAAGLLSAIKALAS